MAAGLPGLAISGLPDASLHEARDRVRAAIVNSGEQWPHRRITVNLLPADLPKRGSGFDLALALVILGAAGAAAAGPAATGPRSSASWAWTARSGRSGACCRWCSPRPGPASPGSIVPAANAAEARLVPGVRVLRGRDAAAVVEFVRAGIPLPDPPARTRHRASPTGRTWPTWSASARGRFALEVAAAGGHHLALFGPPGRRQDHAGPAAAVDPAAAGRRRPRWR